MITHSISLTERNGHSVDRDVCGRIRIEQPLAAALRAILPPHALIFDRRSQGTALAYRSMADCEALRLWLYAMIGQMEQLRDQLNEVANP